MATLLCTVQQQAQNAALAKAYEALTSDVLANGPAANPALWMTPAAQTFQADVSRFGDAVKAAGNLVTGGTVCDETQLTAFIDQLNALGARWAALSGRANPVTSYMTSLKPPAPPWEPSIGWLIKWGLVAGVIYIGYRWVTAAGQASERIRYVRENHGDYIPKNELPAYAGGPRRRRRRK